MKKQAFRIVRNIAFAIKGKPWPRAMIAPAFFALLLLSLPGEKQAASGESARAIAVSGDHTQESFASELYFNFDYKMPERFGKDAIDERGETGKPKYWVDPVKYEGEWYTLSPSNLFIHPRKWEVTLYAIPPIDVPIRSYEWEIWGASAPEYGERVIHLFREQGSYPVRLTITTEDGRTASVAKNVVVRDLLIVSLGDSVASGEGIPDRDGFCPPPSRKCLEPPVWANRQCHRSMYSGPAQAAMALENADPHTSVTFVSLACSGVKIEHLVNTFYKGQQYESGDTVLEPQILALKKLLCPQAERCALNEQRQLDALLITVGANNLHFSDIVYDLASDCITDTGPDRDYCQLKINRRLFRDLQILPQAFDELKPAIDAVIGADRVPSTVYITEYFDPTKYEDWDPKKHPSGPWCLMEQFVDPLNSNDHNPFAIDPEESKWAYENVLVPLNERIYFKAKHDFEWNYIGGIMDAFAHHGYCSASRWVVRNSESWDFQGNKDGTMHPNRLGYQAYARRIVEEVSKRVYEQKLQGDINTVNCQRVTGWAWDGNWPDSPLYLDIYDGDKFLDTVAAANYREDLEKIGFGNGRHAFDYRLPASLNDGGAHAIWAKISGTNVHLGLAPKPLSCSYQGSVTVANCDVISGYALDAVNPDSTIDVDIYVGDRLWLATIPANLDQKTVGTGVGKHCFSYPIPYSLKDPKLTFSLSVKFAETNFHLSNSPRDGYNCPAPVYQGVVDYANCQTISGWAWEKDKPNITVSVDIYVDATPPIRIPANQFYRDPIIPRGQGPGKIGDNYHGFFYPVPPSLKDGNPHLISVKFAYTTTNLSNSSRTIIASPPPTITKQPANAAACLGQPVAFSVTAAGANLSYQWRKNGSNIAGATGSSLPIASASAADQGSYDVLVSDSCNPPVASQPAMLTLTPLPVITSHPVSAATCVGKPVTFSVTATGTGLRYQWRKNGSAITGATDPSFPIPSVSVNDAGSYDVVVSNSCGQSVTSGKGVLTVNGPISITSYPASAGSCVGQPVTFSVSATGANLRYQWRKDGGNIPGEVGASLTIRSLTLGDAGSYSVVVYNGCDSVVAGNASLTINNPIAIIQQPVSVTRCPGQSVTYSAAATGTNLRYLWRKNGGNISGTESSSYTIPSVSAGDAASYSVVVYNGCSTIESARATLTVNTAESLTLSTSSQSFAASGGNGSVGISGCGAWTAVSNDPWITLTGVRSGSGSGMVSYSVAAYQGSTTRAGTITIAGKTLNVTQRPPVPSNNSQFVIQSVPTLMTAGKSYTVSIKMKNTGAATWTAANGYRLVSQAPVNNRTWGLNEVPLPSSAAPNAEITFNFTVTAPATPGVYRFEWQMMQGTSGFGAFSPALDITVVR